MKSVSETEWKCTVCGANLSKGNYNSYYIDAESFDNYFAVRCKVYPVSYTDSYETHSDCHHQTSTFDV